MIRLYRALLRLYPQPFRAAFGEEMCRVFAERIAAASGRAARLRLVVDAFTDVVPNATAVHAEILGQDLRFALRSLLRAPAFAVTAILVVACGVGANTAVFSVADFVLLRPLPFPEPDRLVRLWETSPGYGQMELSPANHRDWREGSRSFESMSAYTSRSVNLIGAGEPARLSSGLVEPGLFATLGVAPALGRTFSSDVTSESDARAAVLSHGLWQSRFGGDRAVLGRTVDLDGIPHDVIGVMPEDFLFPSRDVDLWLPLVLREEHYQDRNDNYLYVVARLAPGVTVGEARADLERVAAELARTYPTTNGRTGATLYPLADGISSRARTLLGALVGSAVCILLLACANLTNLLLARSAAREREMAVRAALGAGRPRLVRQLATESGVLALAGGLAGVGLAAALMPLLARLVPTSLPIALGPELDLRVLAMGGVLTVATGLGFGVVPALRVGGRQGAGALREGGRGGGGRRQRLRAALVGVQVAGSVVLLVAAGLLGRAMVRLLDVDPGFRTEGVLALTTALPFPRYEATATRHEFYDRVLREVRALPGVTAAAYTTGAPISMGGRIWPVQVAGEQSATRDASNTASLRYVTPGFFDVLDIPLVRGRGFDDRDGSDDLYVAVVSESFVERHWPGEDPVGKTFQMAFDERTVVGVARDIRVRGLEQESEPQVYVPHRQVADGSLIFYAPQDLLIAAETEPATLLPAVRGVLRDVDPAQPVADVRTLEQVVRGEAASREAHLRVLVALAGTALLLAGVGLYGLLAFMVSMRSKEIGVRLALGARPARVAGGVLGEAALLTAVGAVPGVVAAWVAAHAMRALLLGIEPGDPLTIGAAVGLVAATSLLGALVPAARAARVSPLEAMSAD